MESNEKTPPAAPLQEVTQAAAQEIEGLGLSTVVQNRFNKRRHFLKTNTIQASPLSIEGIILGTQPKGKGGRPVKEPADHSTIIGIQFGTKPTPKQRKKPEDA